MKRTILIALLWAGVAAPAQAGPADCLWTHLKPDTRAELYAAYERGGLDGLEQVSVDDAQIRGVRGACMGGSAPATAERLRATGIVLVGAALEYSAARHLAATQAIRLQSLTSAWAALTEGERQLLRNAYLPGVASVPVEQTSPILDKVVRFAGWTSAAAKGQSSDNPYRHFLNFFLGRAQSEAYQGQV